MTDTTPANRVAALLHLLDIEASSPDTASADTFIGHNRPGGKGRMFGGQVIAQALVAAERTVGTDRPVHSLHAYFLRGGDETRDVSFEVMRDLDGGSFANRRVVASQGEKPILTLVSSFHRREPGRHHADPMPVVPAPEDLRDEAGLRAEYADTLPAEKREFLLRPRPIELRPVEPRHWMKPEPRAANRTPGFARLDHCPTIRACIARCWLMPATWPCWRPVRCRTGSAGSRAM